MRYQRKMAACLVCNYQPFELFVFADIKNRLRNRRKICGFAPQMEGIHTNSSVSKATPIKSLDRDDTGGQFKQEGWLYNDLICCAFFNKEAPFYWQLGRGGTILL